MNTTELLGRIAAAKDTAQYSAAAQFTSLAQEVRAAAAAQALQMRFHECPNSSVLLRKLKAYSSLYLTVPAQKKTEAAAWIRWIRQCGWKKAKYGAYGSRSMAKLEWTFMHPRWADVNFYFALDFEGNEGPDTCKLVERKVMKEVTEFELVCPEDTAVAEAISEAAEFTEQTGAGEPMDEVERELLEN